ncbi:ABC transporter permease, partial [Pseudoalteromonas tunicata]|uniref:ABC transporter permease n=1 Tax=Pseudoalteromonas tunicata TaxID=314281 RepID=UPI00273D23B6
MIYQLQAAWQSLKQAPLFSGAVIGTLGLTLGALITVLTMAYLLLYKPLPYPDQARLVKAEYVQIDQTGEINTRAFNYQALIHLYQNHDVFEQVALVYYGEQIVDSLAQLPVKNTAFITPEWFDLFAVKMHLGRVFDARDGLNQQHPVAVLSYTSWQQDFASDNSIIGKTVVINQVSFEIIGVAAQQFIEPEILKTGRKTAIWLPWDFNLTSERARSFWWNRYSDSHFIAKLPAGTDKDELAARLSINVNNVWQQHVSDSEFFKGWQVALELNALDGVILGDKGQSVLWLLVAVLGLLIIATANMSNLFISRTVKRGQVIAIMCAIGAKKSALFRLFLSEAGLLLGISAVLALGFAYGMLRLLADFFKVLLPRAQEIQLNGISVAAIMVIGVVLAWLFAAMSMQMIHYRTLASHLKSSGKGTGIQVRPIARQLMITFQVAVASFLVAMSSVTLKQNWQEVLIAEQMPVANLASLRISTATHLSGDNRRNLLEQAVQKISALPEVDQVSRSRSPFEDNLITWSLIELSEQQQVLPEGKVIDAHYFNLMAQTLVAGESFTPDHYGENDNYLVINQVFAQQLGGNAIGKKLSFDVTAGPENAFTIIGVVRTLDIPGKGATPAKVFRARRGSSDLLIQFKAGQSVSKALLNQQLQQLDAGLAVFSYTPLAAQRQKALFRPYSTLVISAGLIVVTLLLTGLGLFSVLRYAVTLRRTEIGIHMAVGAPLNRLFILVFKDNSIALSMGCGLSALGLVMAYYWQPFGYQWVVDSASVFIITTSFIITLSLAFVASLLPLQQFCSRPAI